VCRGERPPIVSSAAGGRPGWLDARPVLELVARLPEALGRSGLVRALCAGGAPMAGISAAAVRGMLDRLLEANLLQIHYREGDRLCRYPLLRLSARAEVLLDEGWPAHVRLEPAAGDPDGRRRSPVPQTAQPHRCESLQGPDPEGAGSAGGPSPSGPVQEAESDALPEAGPDALPGASPAISPDAGQERQQPLQMLRCGAFYELRGPDAETAAALLGLKLGRRGKGSAAYALTGVPLRKAPEAAERLRALGLDVCFLAKRPAEDGPARWVAEVPLAG
jgi:hypothetical protein